MSSNASPGRVRALFATPVIFEELEDVAKLNAKLEQTILTRRAEDGGLKLSNRGGWQSKHDFASWSGEEGRTIIKRALELATEQAESADSSPPRWTFDAWANVSGSGAFNMPHVHGGTYWAAVYYVRLGTGNGGQLVLHDPRMPELRMHAPRTRFKNMGVEVRAEIRPKEGLMVLFPGWLSHSVEPWHGSGERISIAMNIRVA